VALLSTARSFLRRHVPTLQTTLATPSSPPFRVTERLLQGPLMTVGCDAMNAGELDVPFQLERNEQAVGATASFLEATSLRLAEVQVLDLKDRSVRVRFTMVGVPPPRYSIPGTCRQGQALLTVRLNVVVVPQP
jgi:hypothetical protein